MVDGNGTFWVKEGGLSHGWVTQYSGAFPNNHFYVKEGALTATWVDEYANVV